MTIRTPSTAPAGEKGGPPSEPPYPWQLFVGMLLAILVGGAILAVALGLNPLTFQKMAPEVTPGPTGAVVIAAATPASKPTPLIVATTAPAVAPTLVPTPATGVAPQAVQTAAPISTAVATSVSARAGPTTGAAPAAPGAEVTTVPNNQVQQTPVEAAVPPDLAAAIIQGYDKYWSVRVQASSDPNDAGLDLESVMADDELQAAYKTLSQYRQAGIAFHTTVHHQIWITDATAVRQRSSISTVGNPSG